MQFNLQVSLCRITYHLSGADTGTSPKLFFIRKLREITKSYTNDELDFIYRMAGNKDRQFYGMIIEDLYHTDKNLAFLLLNSLDLPEEIYTPQAIRDKHGKFISLLNKLFL